jgi:hypothetical protein
MHNDGGCWQFVSFSLAIIIPSTIVYRTRETVRIFKTKLFGKFARRERIADMTLTEAVDRAERGQVDADLGGGVIKQRVARAGQGRSGGYRTLIAYRSKSRAVFIFGFSKKELDHIDDKQLATLQETAAIWLEADEGKIQKALADSLLREVKDGDQT